MPAHHTALHSRNGIPQPARKTNEIADKWIRLVTLSPRQSDFPFSLGQMGVQQTNVGYTHPARRTRDQADTNPSLDEKKDGQELVHFLKMRGLNPAALQVCTR